MKICEVVRVYPTHRFGGMPIKAKIFSEALVQLGHEVIVITTASDIKKEVLNGVTIHYIESIPQVYSELWWKTSNLEFQKLHEEHKFDILHSESVAGCKIQTDILKIATLHGTAFGLIETYAVMKALGYNNTPHVLYSAFENYKDEVDKYKGFDKLIGVSNKETRVLKEKYFHTNVVRVYNPVNPIFFNHSWAGDGDYYFAYGICATEKGQKFLVELAEKIKIVFAGNTSPGGKVIYLGQLNQEQIAEHLEHCKGFINPTIYCKGFDLTTCEALAVGTPAFISTIQADEDLDDTMCVFITPGAENLHMKIVSASENRDLCKEISRNAKLFAIESFSPKNVVSNFLKECV